MNQAFRGRDMELGMVTEIELCHGETALVDDADAALVENYSWQLSARGYARSTIQGKSVQMHRLIMAARECDEIGHVNGNKLDNRRKNLRFGKHSDHTANQQMHVNNKSGLKGVSWDKTRGKFRVTIRKDYKKIHVGRFDDLEAAARAYNRAALNYFGKFAKLNQSQE